MSIYFLIFGSSKAIIIFVRKSIPFMTDSGKFSLKTAKITPLPGDKHEKQPKQLKLFYDLCIMPYAEYLEFEYTTKTNQLSL